MATAGSAWRWRGIGGDQLGQARRSSVRAGRCRNGRSGHQRSPTVANSSDVPQVVERPAQAAGMVQVGDSDRGLEGRVGDVRGSRWAAIGVRNDRGARPRTVEDHDRRSRHRRPLTWRLSRVFPGPQHTAIPCRNARYRSRTEEARGSNPLPPSHNSPGHWPGEFPPPGRRHFKSLYRAANGHQPRKNGPPLLDCGHETERSGEVPAFRVRDECSASA